MRHWRSSGWAGYGDVWDDRHPIASGASPAGPGMERLPVRAGGQGTRRILSILSSSERKGRWRLAPSCSVVSVLGASELDLRSVELADDRVDLKIISVLGSAELTLPSSLNVEISELAILASNEIDIGQEQPDPGGPVARVRLVSILGSVELRRGPNLTGKQRNEIERREPELESGP